MRVKLWSLFLATYEYLSSSIYGPQLIFEPSVEPMMLMDSERAPTIITHEFSAFVDDLLADWNVHGVAVAVVRSDGVEYGTYGLRAEDGEPVTNEVLQNTSHAHWF